MQVDQLKRRAFITLLGGAAAWPLAAAGAAGRAMRRIGVLMSLAADDPESQARLAAFPQGLQQSGWTIGQNVRVDYRWAGGNADDMRKYATELVALARTLSWPLAARPWRRCNRRPVPCRSCSRLSSTRSAPACREPGAAGRQRYRFYLVRIRHEREMAGAAQGDRAGRDTSGGPS